MVFSAFLLAFMSNVCNHFAITDFLMDLEDNVLVEVCNSLQNSLQLKVLSDWPFNSKHLISTLRSI